MKKLLTLFILLCFTPLVFADSSNILSPGAISNYTDLSVNYLSQIFGTVGNVLAGGQSQMMGQLFYVLNNGVLIASVILIAYSVLLGTVRLASEGVSIAQGKSTLFSMLKLAVGIALIIPNPSTGYSLLQTIVMKVVVEGVGLADSIWDKGLNYLDNGGVVWADTKGTNKQTNLVSPTNIVGMFSADNKFASQIFANEVCMFGSRDSLQPSSSSNNSVSADAPTRPMYDVWENDSNHTFNFPGLNDANAASGYACGSVSWNIKKACSNSNASNCAAAKQALSSLVRGMEPLAQKYYCSQTGSNTPSCVGIDSISNNYAYSILFNSMLNYYSQIQPFAEINGKTADADKAKFIEGAKKEGWLNAGRYYWDIMRFTKEAQDAQDLSGYINTANAPNNEQLNVTNLKDIVNGASAKIAGQNSSYALNASGNVASGFQNYINKVYGKAQSIDGGASPINGEVQPDKVDNSKPPIIGAAAAGVIAPAYINPGIGATLTTAAAGLDVIGNMFHDPGSNPIAFLYKLGQACLKLTISIWVIGGALLGLTMLAYGVCSASNPLAIMGQTVATWFMPMITMIATMLWASGFFLSFYVPLYPFAIFLFASIGWFISVIEAMVAAPLVALGLTHPETHDFLGKSEQALMLLLGVFIQPSLLVIGLIAGIIFSFVTFKLLIYGFSGFIGDIMGNGASTSAHSSNILASAVHSPLYSGSILLTQPLLLVVFCVLTYTLLTQSFSLVFLLRDNVMRWIGAPGSGLASPEHLMGDTRSAISGIGKGTGDAGGAPLSGMAQNGQGISKAYKSMKGEGGGLDIVEGGAE